MSPTKIISVLLADDHAVVRQGLSALLRADGHFKLTEQAQNGREAVELAARLRPDVILMDIAMPVLNGLEATRQIIAANPRARVLMLSAHSDDEYIQGAVAAGAVGFLEKQTSADILTRAIREVAAGKLFYSAVVARRRGAAAHQPGRAAAGKPDRVRLTSRETEVLQLVAEGQANKHIAAILGLSIKTVEKHRQQLMDKINIHDTAGLTRYAIAAGMVESSVQVTII